MPLETKTISEYRKGKHDVTSLAESVPLGILPLAAGLLFP